MCGEADNKRKLFFLVEMSNMKKNRALELYDDNKTGWHEWEWLGHYMELLVLDFQLLLHYSK